MKSPLRRRFRHRGFDYYEYEGTFDMRVGVKTYKGVSHQTMQMIIDDFCANVRKSMDEHYPTEMFDEDGPRPETHFVEFPTPHGHAGGVPVRVRMLAWLGSWWRSRKVHGIGETTR